MKWSVSSTEIFSAHSWIRWMRHVGILLLSLLTSPHRHSWSLPLLLLHLLVVVVMHDEEIYPRQQHNHATCVVHVFVVSEHIHQRTWKGTHTCHCSPFFWCIFKHKWLYEPAIGGPSRTGPHSIMVTSPTAVEKRWAPTRSMRTSNSNAQTIPKAIPKKME